MQIPRIEKIVLNMGVGESTQDSKKARIASEDLTLIAGQKAMVTRAAKSIATFKVREGIQCCRTGAHEMRVKTELWRAFPAPRQ